ncbi:MmcQ/YjbR family DNA-binding protein [Pedobacter sp. KR3-3]|uniref:MmcQ/YjbR family DNA-binding protein n=1 Tax=Pedobacter albus TaxID=3113905 RepID=A0ABU7I480_9SPHI|nr:MmcQ/YjbR family DNA-binding protein [Pedobacter sp. KR3-3]MEE1944166.1 MmcQ/YjbR family DNA-binding protein [Pedobacter sp. KR3-3]
MENNTWLALTFIRNTVMAFPGVTEQLCFETPAFYVNKHIFARLKEDGENLVVHTVEREKWMQKDPQTFFITDHYVNYKYMLVNLERVDPDDLKTLLLTAWKNRAPKKLLNEL